MKKLIIVMVLLLNSAVYAQLIENKIHISVSSVSGNFIGTEMINEDNYISPSLFSNYNQLSGFSAKGLIKLNSIFSGGVNYDYQSANRWSLTDFSDFESSEIYFHSITPVIRIHNKFREKGVFNRFQVFLEIGPQINISHLTLSQVLFDIHPANTTDLPFPMKQRNIQLGPKGTFGVEYSLFQSFGCFVSYSYNRCRVSSEFYNDNLMSYSLVNAGLVFRFKKNKYFYY